MGNLSDSSTVHIPSISSELNVNVSISGEDALKDVARTLERLSGNSDVLKYWKTQEELINDVSTAYANFNNIASRSNAEALVNSLNALKAVTDKLDVSSIVPGYDRMTEAIKRAEDAVGKSVNGFGRNEFSEAFKSFEVLQAYGANVQDVFSRLSGDNDIESLRKHIEELSVELARAKREAFDAQTELKRIADGSGVTELKEELLEAENNLERIREKMKGEFDTFLRANDIDPSYDDRFYSYFDSIADGSMTAKEAIAMFKSEYSELLTNGGGTFDSESVVRFTEALETACARIEEINNYIHGIDPTGTFAPLQRSLEDGTVAAENQKTALSGIGNSASSVAEVVDALDNLAHSDQTVSETSQQLYSSLGDVFNVLKDIGQLNEGNIDSLGIMLRNISKLDGLRIDSKSLDNLVGGLSSLSEISNASNLSIISNINLAGLSELKVSKASMRNLAEYLPQIANVNVQSLEALSRVNLTNFNGVKVSKSDVASLTSLADVLASVREILPAVETMDSEAAIGIDDVSDSAELAAESIAEMNAAMTSTSDNSESGVAAGIENIAESAVKASGDISEMNASIASTSEGVGVEASVSIEAVGESARETAADISEMNASVSNISNKVDTGVANDIKDIGESAKETTRNVEEMNASMSKSPSIPVRSPNSLEGVTQALISQDISETDAQRIASDISGITGEIQKVSVAWKELENGAASVASVTVKSVGAMNESFSQTSKYIKDANGELQLLQRGVITIDYSKSNPKSKPDGGISETAMDAERISTAMLEIQKAGAQINAAIASAEKLGVDSEELQTLREQASALASLQKATKDGAASNEYFARTMKDIRLAVEAARISVNRQAKDYSSPMSQSDINIGQLKIQKEKDRIGGVLSDAGSYNISTAEVEALKAQSVALDELSNKAASASMTNKEFAQSLSEISLAASAASNAVKEQISNAALVPGTDAYAKAQKKLSNEISIVNRELQKNSAAQSSSHESSREAYSALQNQRDALKSLQKDLEDGRVSQGQFNSAMKDSEGVVAKATATIKEGGDAHKTFGKRVGDALKKFSGWFSVTRIVISTVRYIKKMVSTAIELDTAMTELKKVTDETDAVYSRFLDNASSRAKSLGASISDVVNATADFARLGYSIDEASSLADAAIVYKNVGDGISDISDASESLISTMKAFGIEADDAMSIVDKFNEVGNNFAISSKGVGDALMRSASALATANNTIDESIALVTAANTVVQNPESVGTAMKTLSMYLRAAKTEAEESGESTEYMANSVSELRQEILNLTGSKVDIQIDENTFKSTYQIMKELSQVWGELTDVSKANILEIIGGKRNGNVVSSLLENFELAEDIMASSVNSAGSAIAENEKYLQSIQGHIDKFKASFEDLSRTIAEGGLIKTIVDIGRVILDIVTWGASAVQSLGGLKTAILGLVSALLMFQSELIVTKAKVLIFSADSKLLVLIKNIGASIKNLITTVIPAAIEAWKGYAAGTVSASSAMQASIPVIGLVLAALTVLVGALSLVNSASDEAAQKALAAAESAADAGNEISNLMAEYLSLSNSIDSTSDSYSKLAQTEESLLKQIDVEKAYVKELTKEYGSYADAIKTAVKEKLHEKEIEIRGGINASEKAVIEARSDLSREIAENYMDGNVLAISELYSSEDDMAAAYKAQVALSEAGYLNFSDLNDEGLSRVFSMWIGDEFGNVRLEHNVKTVEGVIELYGKLREMMDIVGESVGENSAVYNKLLGVYTALTPAVSDYISIISSLNETVAEQQMLTALMGKEIPKTRTEFDEFRDSLINDAEAGNEFIGTADDIASAFDAILSKQPEFANYYDGTGINGLTSAFDAYNSAVSNMSNVSSVFNKVSDSLKAVADLQKAVANGFTMSADKAMEFAKVYPEILNGAKVAKNGQIKLNKDVVNSFIKSKEGEVKASVDTEITQLEADKAVLTAKKAFAEAELQMAKSVAEGKGDLTLAEAEYKINMANAMVQATVAAGMDEANAYRLAMQAMSLNTVEFDNVARQAATDVSGNFNAAAYNAAMAVYNNMRNASYSVDGFTRTAWNAAKALSGAGNGIVAGTIGVFTGKAGTTLGGGKSMKLSAGNFNGTNYSYNPQTVSLSKFISDLEIDISNYSKAISQIDGQIAALKALRNTPLKDFASDSKGGKSGGSGGSGGSGNKGGSGGSKSSKSDDDDDDNWFETQYKLHQHLLDMDAEDMADYLEWLNSAYQQAYDEGIITLDDFFKYQEEVYQGLHDLFKDYLNDVEHEISMRENFEGETSKIIELYKSMVTAVENEIQTARAQGLDDTDDYIQELQDKWASYRDAIKNIEQEIKDNAKDSLDELVDIRVDMLKQDIDDQKEAIDKKLDYLKDFYDKQKEMLQDVYDEEKYLEEQSEKRKAVSDIQAEMAQLEYDNSAWAQKRKLQLAEELADAQKNLDDFEKDHALSAAQDELDKLYEMQEKELNAQSDLLDEKENNAKALYEQALEDIKNGSIELYEEMVEWNNVYGDGIEDTIKAAWEEAYVALKEYKDLYGSLYKDVDLANATDYEYNKESWDTAVVSGTGAKKQESATEPETPENTPASSDTKPSENSSAPSLAKGSTIQVKKSATRFSAKSNNVKMSKSVPGSKYTVYKTSGDQVLIGRNGVYTGWIKKSDIVGYATGTDNATNGLHRIDEYGSETIFESRDGTKYKLFSGGEKVLNAKASTFLYDFANSGGKILGKIFKDAIGAGMFTKPLPSMTTNDIRLGDIIVNGSADTRTVSEMRRAQRDEVSMLLKEFGTLQKR